MDEHFLRELQQIILIEKKLNQKLEDSQNVKNPDHIRGIIDDLDQLSNFTTSVTTTLSTKKTIERELLTKLNHELRTPLVPIRAYTDMLLAEKLGELSDEQTNRLRVVSSSIKRLEEVVTNLLDQEQFDIIENNKGNQANSSHKIHELEQENVILEKMVQSEEKKNIQLSRKHVFTIAGSIAVIGIVITAYSLFVVELVGQEYRVPNTVPINDGYVIQNLQGDTIDTWLSWRIVPEQTLHVGIVDGKKYPDKVELIKQVILSEESIEIDDSLLGKGTKGSTSVYYVGWAGALKQAADIPTQFSIPQNFQVIETTSGQGEITIMLTDEKDGDGYSGYTKSIADSAQNQILKSTITIYEVDKLTDDQFKTILRHELGHAIGLAHSTAPEDLMAPTIQTQYPYISDCDIDSIVKLYDGGKKSQVVCEK